MHTKMYSLVIGGIAIDDIQLPHETLTGVVGGSAIYGSLASSIFTPTYLGGVMGEEFPKDFHKRMIDLGIDMSMLQRSKKPSFHWSARYSSDLSTVTTLHQQLNAFEDFKTPNFKDAQSPIAAAFVSNIDPEIQIKILNSLPKKTIKIIDSMDLWVVEKRKQLREAISLADILLINEAEMQLFVPEPIPVVDKVEKMMEIGPKVVIYKRGEYGLTMYGKLGTMTIPSYPLSYAVDPSGAGDVLGGSLAGVLARYHSLTPKAMKTAIVLASIVASYVVEDYVTDGVIDLTLEEVLNRTKLFLTQLPSDEEIDLASLRE